MTYGPQPPQEPRQGPQQPRGPQQPGPQGYGPPPGWQGQGPQGYGPPPGWQGQWPPPPPPQKPKPKVWPWLIAAFAVFLIVVGVNNKGASTTTAGQDAVPPLQTGAAYPSYSAPGYDTPAPAATTTTEPQIPLQTFSGTGDDVVTLTKPAGIGVVTFKCPRCSSNTIVQSNGSDSLLVNEIGPYSGKRWIDAEESSITTQLTVQAKGAWTLSVGGLDQATKASGSATGKGDDVIVIDTPATTAQITNSGQSNFIVQTATAGGSSPDLAVNEIGSYSGRVPLALPGIVEVTSAGSWSIVPG